MERLTIKAPSGLIHLKDNKESTVNTAIKKLSDYEDLEEQGKLLKLPAAIGDTIFFIFRDCPKDYKEEYCTDHEGSCENCDHRVAEIMSREFRISDIQNMDNIFVTKEEAEAVLNQQGR